MTGKTVTGILLLFWTALPLIFGSENSSTAKMNSLSVRLEIRGVFATVEYEIGLKPAADDEKNAFFDAVLPVPHEATPTDFRIQMNPDGQKQTGKIAYLPTPRTPPDALSGQSDRATLEYAAPDAFRIRVADIPESGCRVWFTGVFLLQGPTEDRPQEAQPDSWKNKRAVECVLPFFPGVENREKFTVSIFGALDRPRIVGIDCRWSGEEFTHDDSGEYRLDGLVHPVPRRCDLKIMFPVPPGIATWLEQDHTGETRFAVSGKMPFNMLFGDTVPKRRIVAPVVLWDASYSRGFGREKEIALVEFLLKDNDVKPRLITFNEKASEPKTFNNGKELADELRRMRCGGGTDLAAAFAKARECKAGEVFFFSDMADSFGGELPRDFGELRIHSFLPKRDSGFFSARYFAEHTGGQTFEPGRDTPDEVLNAIQSPKVQLTDCLIDGVSVLAKSALLAGRDHFLLSGPTTGPGAHLLTLVFLCNGETRRYESMIPPATPRKGDTLRLHFNRLAVFQKLQKAMPEDEIFQAAAQNGVLLKQTAFAVRKSPKDTVRRFALPPGPGKNDGVIPGNYFLLPRTSFELEQTETGKKLKIAADLPKKEDAFNAYLAILDEQEKGGWKKLSKDDFFRVAAERFFQSGKNDLGLHILANLTELHPDYPRMRLELALQCAFRGRKKEAEILLRRIVSDRTAPRADVLRQAKIVLGLLLREDNPDESDQLLNLPREKQRETASRIHVFLRDEDARDFLTTLSDPQGKPIAAENTGSDSFVVFRIPDAQNGEYRLTLRPKNDRIQAPAREIECFLEIVRCLPPTFVSRTERRVIRGVPGNEINRFRLIEEDVPETSPEDAQTK